MGQVLENTEDTGPAGAAHTHIRMLTSPRGQVDDGPGTQASATQMGDLAGSLKAWASA